MKLSDWSNPSAVVSATLCSPNVTWAPAPSSATEGRASIPRQGLDGLIFPLGRGTQPKLASTCVIFKFGNDQQIRLLGSRLPCLGRPVSHYPKRLPSKMTHLHAMVDGFKMENQGLFDKSLKFPAPPLAMCRAFTVAGGAV